MKKKNEHYVDNAKFLEAMKEYKQLCEDAKKNKKGKFMSQLYWWLFSKNSRSLIMLSLQTLLTILLKMI